MTDPTTTSVFQYIDTGQSSAPQFALTWNAGSSTLSPETFMDGLQKAYAQSNPGHMKIVVSPQTFERMKLWNEYGMILTKLFGNTDPTREQLKKVRFPAKFRGMHP